MATPFDTYHSGAICHLCREGFFSTGELRGFESPPQDLSGPGTKDVLGDERALSGATELQNKVNKVVLTDLKSVIDPFQNPQHGVARPTRQSESIVGWAKSDDQISLRPCLFLGGRPRRERERECFGVGWGLGPGGWL